MFSIHTLYAAAFDKPSDSLLAVVVNSGTDAYATLMICKFTTGLRVPKEEEIGGLDYTRHGETIYL